MTSRAVDIIRTRLFPAKSQKFLNFDIIKTTQPISSKFCTVIKTNNATSVVVPRMRTKNPIWRTPPYWKSKNCNNSATIHPIATKFCTDTQMVTANYAECKKLHILKIQDGGRPPFWKSKTCNIWATIHPIATKFCMNKQIMTLNLTGCKNLRILKMQDSGRPPY